MFLEKQVILTTDLYAVYHKKLKEFGLLEYGEDIYSHIAVSAGKFLHSIKKEFGKGCITVCDCRKNVEILHWSGNDVSSSLCDYISMLKTHIAVYEEKISVMEDKCSRDSSDADISESALLTLRSAMDSDCHKVTERLSDANKDFRTLLFKDFVKNNVNVPLWNFLFRLGLNKKAFSRSQRNKEKWDTLHTTDSECDTNSRHFLSTFFSYSHFLYIFSSGECNKPLPMVLSDVLDKYSKSSSKCMQIFNAFGLTVSKDTLLRFQTKLAEDHLKQVPFNDICRTSFSYASLDNLDFMSRHACVRASVQKRGLNCTTYLAGQPRPSESLQERVPDSPTQLATSVEDSATRPKKRRISDIKCDDNMVIQSISEDIALMNIQNNTPILFADFEITEEERLSFENVTQDLFSYMVMKSSKTTLQDTKHFFPMPKVFLARKSNISVQPSLNSYLGVLTETCDNKDTVFKVLRILYNKMEVGKSASHLVVVGDGKTFHYLQKLKKDHPHELSWMLPFPGDWHVLKNYAHALLKIYGPPGLNELLSLLHKGKTEKSVSSGTDFDKTFAFLLQTWEAMYRLEVEMFLLYKEKEDQSVLQKFNCKDFLKDVADIMSVNLNTDKTVEQYAEAFLSLQDKLDGYYDEFINFVSDMSSKSNTFSFWKNFVHQDCMTYILLFLAGRSGNWNLRMFVLKKMMPVFHVNSTFYYRLLPQHIHDLLLYPTYILDQFKNGGFVMNLTGKPWSNVFLDENHETTINKDVKEVVSSLSSFNINGKTQYLACRAKMLKQFHQNIQVSGPQQGLSRDTAANAEVNENNVCAYMAKLNDSTLFVHDHNSETELRHLFSGEVASKTIKESLLTLEEVGNGRLQNYVKTCLTHEVAMREKQKKAYKFIGIKNFGQIKHKGQKEKAVEKFYKSSTNFLTRVIQWCTANSIPPSDIQQHITLPMAIAETNGLPFQRNKADTVQYYRKNFKQAFTDTLSHLQSRPATLVIDGMQMIYHHQPMPQHNTFGKFLDSMFEKCILNRFRSMNLVEIHVCFDQQKNENFTPKDIERSRRDSDSRSCKPNNITSSTHIPQVHWKDFLTNRANKKLFVEYLAERFLELAESLLLPKQVLVVSGGHTESKCNAHAVMAEEQPDGDIVMVTKPLPKLFNNHYEGDSLVWLHALQRRGDSPVLIWSSDSDIPHIGMPFVDKYPDGHFILQLKDNASECEYLDLNKLMKLMSLNADLQCIPFCFIGPEMQMLFIVSGCDYVSFFKYHTKRNFIDVYLDNIMFISFKEEYTGALSLTSIHEWDDGLMAFYRLVGCVYFRMCASSFRISLGLNENPSPEQVLVNLMDANSDLSEMEATSLWLDQIRGMVMKQQGCEGEDCWPPSNDALQYHWKRCCFVGQMWEQADNNFLVLPDITKWGWSVIDDNLEIKWDSDSNVKHVDKYRKLWTSGCSCKSLTKPCNSRNCGCRKSNKSCGPACKCCDKCFNKPIDPSIEALMQESGTQSGSSDAHIEVVQDDCITDDASEYCSDSNDLVYSDDEDTL